MRDQRLSTLRILTAHFFRRFFDNDSVQTEGDTQTTVVRALSFVAVPGLFVTFLVMLTHPKTQALSGIAMCCYFVTFSFVVAGAVAVFEWEMLFPDKLDFLVLTPLPVRRMEMFAAKVAALAAFVGLFIFAANVFSTLLLAVASISSKKALVIAHIAATAGAGIFAALLVLVLGGVMLCVMNASIYRLVSPLVQMLAVMALALLLLGYFRLGQMIPMLMRMPTGAARWLPPLWFAGLYLQMLEGSRAPEFAAVMARYAVLGLVSAAGVVAITYPLAWARVRRMTIEGVARRLGGGRSRVLEWLTARVVRRPGERAVFYFIGQTLARNNRYQVYMAIYCGAGLALAVSSAVSIRAAGGAARLALSDYGLHAVMPMLLFWAIAGLRTAFAFPVNLQAGWIFRVTGVDLRDCAAAARRWVGLCAGCVMAGVLLAQRLAGWDARKLLAQAVCGLGLCVLLTDGFFFAQRSVPFNQPRMPGKVSFPLMLTLYIGVFPLYVEGMSMLEMRLERHLMRLLLVGFTAAALHLLAVALRGLSSEAEDNAEYDGEFQLLGLTTQ